MYTYIYIHIIIYPPAKSTKSKPANAVCLHLSKLNPLSRNQLSFHKPHEGIVGCSEQHPKTLAHRAKLKTNLEAQS